MRIFGITIHMGPCPQKSVVRVEHRFSQGRDYRSDSERMIDWGHKETCYRVTHPNSLSPCDCGLEEQTTPGRKP